jgi:hypothetical protein
MTLNDSVLPCTLRQLFRLERIIVGNSRTLILDAISGFIDIDFIEIDS